MKIYIVYQSSFDDWGILKCFRNKQDAIDFANLPENKKKYHYIGIEEAELI